MSSQARQRGVLRTRQTLHFPCDTGRPLAPSETVVVYKVTVTLYGFNKTLCVKTFHKLDTS